MSRVSGGSWDCHAHVIGDPERYPLFAGRSYDPPPAPLDAYLALLDRHGLARGVLVQPSVYGFDNSCLLDALDEAGGRLFGIVVLDPDSRSRDLEAMHRRGVRGVRCNLLNPGGLDPRLALRWNAPLRELGWHVEVHAAIDELVDPRLAGSEVLPDLERLVDSLDVPVVIDHMGRPAPGRTSPSAGSNGRLIALARAGRCFVKLSAPYRLSVETAPWRDVTPLARALLDANPARCLWATDWPHTSTAAVIRESDLFDALAEWCPDAPTRRAMMEEVPRRLFGAD